ncbi:MAG: ATP-binding cassette domain-containing protein [Bifidobacteriaceae bacterium]|jgi:ABC-2 type transport system ATP-binding protein|nr:ATP-binding cassette domain-containing protein [Bifidobacteriaceae bacterium]
MIEVKNLSKNFGHQKALDSISFVAHAGVVTGFLGPNGAGKTTTMKVLLGLISSDSGTAYIDGRPFGKSPNPSRTASGLLDSKAALGSRKAKDHLLAVAEANNIAKDRITYVLELVGLKNDAKRQIRTFSLGMYQRLGIAEALLGDPHNLILDEPMNGLDPEGIKWIRDLLRQLAKAGKTIFLSSHILSEVQQTVDDLVIISKGRVVKTGKLSEINQGFSSLEEAFISLTDDNSNIEYKAG